MRLRESNYFRYYRRLELFTKLATSYGVGLRSTAQRDRYSQSKSSSSQSKATTAANEGLPTWPCVSAPSKAVNVWDATGPETLAQNSLCCFSGSPPSPVPTRARLGQVICDTASPTVNSRRYRKVSLKDSCPKRTIRFSHIVFNCLERNSSGMAGKSSSRKFSASGASAGSEPMNATV